MNFGRRPAHGTMMPTNVPAASRMLQRSLSVIATLALLIGCGSAPRPTLPRRLPANVMAQPRGTVGIVVVNYASPLPTALRTIGAPYRLLPLAQVQHLDLTQHQVIIVDEYAMEEDKTFAAYDHLVDNARKNAGTLIVLHQSTETLQRAARTARYRLQAREAEYRLTFAAPRRDDPVMTTPNSITRSDLDSLSPTTHQLVFGGPDARAIISANLVAPDSSATLLWEPLDRGAIWYMTFPIAARAADGYATEQRLLANLVSNK